MQIKHVGLPISSNKPSDSQQPAGIHSGSQEGQQGSGISQANDALIISTMSGRRLEWLRLLLGNSDFQLFSQIKDMLGLLAALKAVYGAKEFAALSSSIENALLPFAGPLEAKDFSAGLVQKFVNLYLHAEELKFDMLNLASLLPDEGKEASALKEKIVKLMTYFESVNFFNRQGAQDSASKTLFLYFPFSVSAGPGREKKMELVIYPQEDSKGRIRQDAYSFNLIVDTESLGRVKIFMQVNKNRVSCNVGAQDQLAFSALERSSGELSERLKKIRFVLNSFDCGQAVAGDYLPTLLPRLEMKA